MELSRHQACGSGSEEPKSICKSGVGGHRTIYRSCGAYRTPKLSTLSLTSLKPSIILVTFVFFGSGALLFVKAKQGPGPFLFACVFGCICLGNVLAYDPFALVSIVCLDIILTTAALFPYPYYRVLRLVSSPNT